MKKKQQTYQKPASPNPAPTKELTDEQLHQVVGGLNPQPLPPARNDAVIGYPPGDPWHR